ncbi:MAG: hypothetical protein WAZ18_04770 [Alphaproteobacteria bacterium]
MIDPRDVLNPLQRADVWMNRTGDSATLATRADALIALIQREHRYYAGLHDAAMAKWGNKTILNDLNYRLGYLEELERVYTDRDTSSPVWGFQPASSLSNRQIRLLVDGLDSTPEIEPSGTVAR